jgi:hypothetical protein
MWIILATVVAQTVTWMLEQTLAMAPAGAADVRWLVLLVYALAVMFPAGLSYWRERGAFALGVLAAGSFVLLTVPARLAGISRSHETALLLAAAALVFLLLWRGRTRPLADGLGLALFIGGLLGIPWVIWGALGSVVDIVLSLVVAGLFGLSAARVLQLLLPRAEGMLFSRQGVLSDGVSAWLALLVMTSGLGVNGNLGLLGLAIPAVGLALAPLYRQKVLVEGGRAANWPALALLTGLAAFWPLAFIDADELAALAGSAVGEIDQWANLAAYVGLFLALAAGLILATVWSQSPRRGAAWTAWAAVAAWMLVGALYLGVGQPGLYGERLFVIMERQADLSSVAQITSPVERRAAVYRLLVQEADTSQAPLRAALNRWGIDYRSYYLENALEVQGGPLVRWWLARQPDVDRVLDSPILRPLPEPLPEDSRGDTSPPDEVLWNLKMIGADRVWEELGITGEGIVVGQADSGAQGDHPELADSYLGRDGDNAYRWYDPWNGSVAPVDLGGHGTHTLGTVLGNRVGVAPDADWIGCVNLGRNLGNPAYYLDCMQFLLAPFPQDGDPLRDGRPELGAHVLNNSWGCPPSEGCDSQTMLHAVDSLRAAGIFVVSSAGNDGDRGCGSVADPIALYDAVYSVGAIDIRKDLANFSSIGPVMVDGSERGKPDIAAPGVRVFSAFPGGTYASLSGTSMASPHLAGVVALMWSANPDLIGDVDQTEQILNETAFPYTGVLPGCVDAGTPNNAVGFGIVDAYAAVRRAIGK